MNLPKELETEIIEFIFNDSPDHREAMRIFQNNPWEALSMYEVYNYPENLVNPIMFAVQAEIPEYILKRLDKELYYANMGKPVITKYPRITNVLVNVGGKSAVVSKFGRLIIEDDHIDDDDNFM